MGLYNFKRLFVPKILDGTKTHTIRAPRKGSQDIPGNTMHLYTGLRTKNAKLLGRFECIAVDEITIDRTLITVDRAVLFIDERDALAKRDGFQSFEHMLKFWEGRLPFSGHIFHWKYDPKAVNR